MSEPDATYMVDKNNLACPKCMKPYKTLAGLQAHAAKYKHDKLALVAQPVQPLDASPLSLNNEIDLSLVDHGYAIFLPLGMLICLNCHVGVFSQHRAQHEARCIAANRPTDQLILSPCESLNRHVLEDQTDPLVRIVLQARWFEPRPPIPVLEPPTASLKCLHCTGCYSNKKALQKHSRENHFQERVEYEDVFVQKLFQGTYMASDDEERIGLMRVQPAGMNPSQVSKDDPLSVYSGMQLVAVKRDNAGNPARPMQRSFEILTAILKEENVLELMFDMRKAFNKQDPHMDIVREFMEAFNQQLLGDNRKNLLMRIVNPEQSGPGYDFFKPIYSAAFDQYIATAQQLIFFVINVFYACQNEAPNDFELSFMSMPTENFAWEIKQFIEQPSPMAAAVLLSWILIELIPLSFPEHNLWVVKYLVCFTVNADLTVTPWYVY